MSVSIYSSDFMTEENIKIMNWIKYRSRLWNVFLNCTAFTKYVISERIEWLLASCCILVVRQNTQVLLISCRSLYLYKFLQTLIRRFHFSNSRKPTLFRFQTHSHSRDEFLLYSVYCELHTYVIFIHIFPTFVSCTYFSCILFPSLLFLQPTIISLPFPPPSH